MANKPRILYILRQYPLVCETYIQSEIDALRDDYEIRVVSFLAVKDAAEYSADPAPYKLVSGPDEILQEIASFRPQVLHAHWLLDVRMILDLARATGTPFTIRAHSFDTLYAPYMKHWFENAPGDLGAAGADPLLLGILAFPFSRPFLEKCGVPEHKIIDCPAVVKTGMFLDRSPNHGEAVMNVGACLPKKLLPAYLQVAKEAPELEFDLYPVGYQATEISDLNQRMGSPVNIHRCVKHQAMPAIYKAHRWLVYSACPKLRNVGWPMAVAEAQASGTGVIMFNIRPDLKDYIGDGGFLVDSPQQVLDLIRRPVPEDVREAGFEQAKKSDIESHKHLLTDLWQPCVN